MMNCRQKSAGMNVDRNRLSADKTQYLGGMWGAKPEELAVRATLVVIQGDNIQVDIVLVAP